VTDIPERRKEYQKKVNLAIPDASAV